MKKRSLLLFGLALLSSCSISPASQAAKDAELLFSVKDEEIKDATPYFSHSLKNEKKNDYFEVSYCLNDAKKDYHHVKCVITPDREKHFFFGYEHSYQIVQDSQKQSRSDHIYNGFKITFSSTVEVDELFVYFISDEVSLFSKVNCTKE